MERRISEWFHDDPCIFPSLCYCSVTLSHIHPCQAIECGRIRCPNGKWNRRFKLMGGSEASNPVYTPARPAVQQWVLHLTLLRALTAEARTGALIDRSDGRWRARGVN
jgi:hypothetical protein